MVVSRFNSVFLHKCVARIDFAAARRLLYAVAYLRILPPRPLSRTSPLCHRSVAFSPLIRLGFCSRASCHRSFSVFFFLARPLRVSSAFATFSVSRYMNVAACLLFLPRYSRDEVSDSAIRVTGETGRETRGLFHLAQLWCMRWTGEESGCFIRKSGDAYASCFQGLSDSTRGAAE